MAGERASASPIFRVSGLRRDFGDLTAVDGFDLDLAAGECVSLIGHNGSGKSTACVLPPVSSYPQPAP